MATNHQFPGFCLSTVPLLIGFFLVAVYFSGLTGPFVFDDIVNIVDNPAVAVTDLNFNTLSQAAASNSSGILGRPFAALSFAVNHYLAGGFTNTLQFKLTNLVIHFVNAALVYWLVSLLFGRITQSTAYLSTRGGAAKIWLPALIALAWALHPVQLTSVLYVVQRMTSLSATFVLAGLIIFVYGRMRLEKQRPYALTLMAGGLVAGLALGLAAKETAALLFLYALVVEYVIFNRDGMSTPDRRRLVWFYAAMLTIPIAGVLIWGMNHPGFIQSSYAIRDFTLIERLLTEPRILWFYLALIFYPDIRNFGLFHDDITISTGLLTPLTTIAALSGLAILLALAILTRNKAAMLSFAVLWYLAGHSMESSFIGLELAHEHRNYLPALGPITGAMYGLFAAFHRAKTPRLPLMLGATLVVALGAITWLRVQTWTSVDGIIQSSVRHHPGSARSQAMLAELLATQQGAWQEALRHYQIASNLEPGEPSHRIRMAMLAAQAASPRAGETRSARKSDEAVLIISEMLPDFFSADRRSQGRMLALKSDISDKIADQLRQKVPSPSTRQTIGSLSVCISETSGRCGGLSVNAIKWYRAIIGNPNVDDVFRSNTLVYLFDTGIQLKDYPMALEASALGKRFYPADPTYALMEANALLLLDRLDEAEHIIRSVRASPVYNISAELMENTNILTSMIEKRRNRKITQPSSKEGKSHDPHSRTN